jgi:hypothetical protein
MLSNDYLSLNFSPGSQRHEDRPLFMFFRNRSAIMKGNFSSEGDDPKAKKDEKEEPKEEEEKQMEEEEKKKTKKAKEEPEGVIGNSSQEGELAA